MSIENKKTVEIYKEKASTYLTTVLNMISLNQKRQIKNTIRKYLKNHTSVFDKLKVDQKFN